MIRNKMLTIAFSATLMCALHATAQDQPAVQPVDAQSQSNAAIEPAAPSLEFAIIKTSEASTLEALAYSGGAYTKKVKLQHVAVLVRHPQGTFLFDTGLGKQVDAQFKADMPFWAKPFFSYGPVNPVRTQLDAAGLPPINRIILSHGHWDHMSGIVDFPEAEVWVSAPEKIFLSTPHAVAVLPSQISSPSIKWVSYDFQPKPYRDFAQSVDLFGDGSAVLVPLPGHTPGAAGLYLTLKSGKQYFFVGDTAWQSDAIKKQRPKMWLAGELADSDRVQTLKMVEALHHLQEQDPHLVIVPAHDATVQDVIGYFPKFVK